MKVTGEMVDRAARMLANFAHPTGKRAVRNALEAALADVPDISALESKLRKIQEAAFASGSTMEERIDRIQDLLSGNTNDEGV